MMHKARCWALHEVASAEKLARMLVERTWTLCSGFYVHGHGDHVFLNDATSEDGAQEYAVARRSAEGWLQIESFTMSWSDEGRALLLIKEILAGEFDSVEYAFAVQPRLEMPGRHGCCSLCE
jgi:hypothetical protein